MFRISNHRLKFSCQTYFQGDKGDPNHMTNSMFRGITGGLIFSSLAVSIMFPKVDTILALSGATAGCLIGFILPALIYLKSSDPGDVWRGFAKFVLVMGMITTIAGVFNIMFPEGGPPQLTTDGLNPKHITADQNMGQKIKLDVPLPDQVEPEKAEQLDHGDIVAMLAKLQGELEETKRELRAEKALRIENEINELKEQLKAQNVAVDGAAVAQNERVAEVPKDPEVKAQPDPPQPKEEVVEKPKQKTAPPAAEKKAVEPAEPAKAPEPVQKEEKAAEEAIKQTVEENKPKDPVPAQSEVQKDPVAEAPKAVVAEPENVAPQAVADKPPAAAPEPVAAQPAAAQPAVAQPAAAQPAAAQPAAAQPAAAQPAAPESAEQSAEEVQEKLEQIKKLEKEKDDLLAENKKAEEKKDAVEKKEEEIKHEEKRDNGSIEEVKKEI